MNSHEMVRILFLAANSLTTSPLDLEEELRSLDHELRSVRFREQMDLVQAHAVRPDDLVRYLRQKAPTIVHFSGHGSAEGIILRGDLSDVKVRATSLARVFRDRGVKLVFLNACFSDYQAEALKAVVPVVVGTTASVDDEAARRFSSAFYRAIGDGYAISDAFRDGCDVVDANGLEDVFKLYGAARMVLCREQAQRRADLDEQEEAPTWRSLLREGMSLLYGLQGCVDVPAAQRSFLAAAETGDPVPQVWLARLKAVGSCSFPRDETAARSVSREDLGKIEARAHREDSDAALVFGFACLEGIGREVNLARAVISLKQAADKGDLVAMNCLGTLADRGVSPAEALTWCSRAADAGNSLAMTNLALRYLTGQGVDPNPSLAIKWFQAAANRGYAPAMNSLGDVYRNGKVVQRDVGAAVKWYQLGADHGDSTAMTNLGWAYFKGEGIKLDGGKAVENFRRAIELQNSYAMCSLAALYADGNPLPRDYAMALQLWIQAAELGDVQSMACLGEVYAVGLGVNQNLTTAASWYQRAAECGNAEAAVSLAKLYIEGKGVEKNPAEAVRWYRVSAELGNAAAMSHLAEMYDSGSGVQQDRAEAFLWYLRAAEAGNWNAMNALGFKYQKGDGVEINAQQALSWYLRAAKEGSSEGMNNAGVLYELTQSPAESVSWYHKAAEAGNAYGMYNLGRAYKFGIGVEKDPKNEREWLAKAHRVGHPTALSLLNETSQGESFMDGIAQVWRKITK